MTDTHFIQGTAKVGTSGRSQDLFNPATGSVVGAVPLASVTEVDAAVEAVLHRRGRWGGHRRRRVTPSVL